MQDFYYFVKLYHYDHMIYRSSITTYNEIGILNGWQLANFCYIIRNRLHRDKTS